MRIGTYQLKNRLILAPMAGITDRPFRQLCKQLGAGMAVSEMVSSDVRLLNTKKTQQRLNHEGEPEPRVVQIAGADPTMIADAARLSVDQGAQILDINMGCPAKKVCKKMAGSALLKEPTKVGRILDAVVNAVSVPVTLKIRTGVDPDHRNGVKIARIAEMAGIQSLAVHGRTRACGFRGNAEYETIRLIKNAVKIPVVANGDIDSPVKAKKVLAITGADAIMIGRAAQGHPWLFREIHHYLCTANLLKEPTKAEIRNIMLGHLENLYAFYGEWMGVRIARKHIAWYLQQHSDSARLRQRVNRIETTAAQMRIVDACFDT